MTNKIPRYVGSQRRRWALDQDELAYLVGLKSGSNVSRIEHGKRHPTIKAAFGYEALFGVSASTLFPALFEGVEDALMRRAYKLHEELRSDDSRKARVKRQLLQEALGRARSRHSNEEV